MNNLVQLHNAKTICIECKNLSKAEGSADIWYNYHCIAAEVYKTPEIDSVSGKLMYRKSNDLGTQYLDDQPHPYCREINLCGECPYFKNKEDLNAN